MTDNGDGKLKELDNNGAILHSIAVGNQPAFPTFDGTNIWVPNYASDTVTVVRVKDSQGGALASPFVLATLNGNGLDSPASLAFDGERILAVNALGDSISLWKAADLTPLGSFNQICCVPYGVCSDGLNFWITLNQLSGLARF